MVGIKKTIINALILIPILLPVILLILILHVAREEPSKKELADQLQELRSEQNALVEKVDSNQRKVESNFSQLIRIKEEVKTLRDND